MKYDVDKRGLGLTVSLSGHLTYNSFSVFNALLHELDVAAGAGVVFDLSDLGRLDSAGLSLLYAAREELGERGIAVSLASPRNEVKRLLELTDAARCFEILN